MASGPSLEDDGTGDALTAIIRTSMRRRRSMMRGSCALVRMMALLGAITLCAVRPASGQAATSLFGQVGITRDDLGDWDLTYSASSLFPLTQGLRVEVLGQRLSSERHSQGPMLTELRRASCTVVAAGIVVEGPVNGRVRYIAGGGAGVMRYIDELQTEASGGLSPGPQTSFSRQEGTVAEVHAEAGVIVRAGNHFLFRADGFFSVGLGNFEYSQQCTGCFIFPARPPYSSFDYVLMPGFKVGAGYRF